MVREELLKRGCSFHKITAGSKLIKIVTPDGRSTLSYGSVPLNSGHVGYLAAKNKRVTQALFADLMPCPQSMYVRRLDDATEFIEDLINKGMRLVVKPLDGAHGNGVSTCLSNLEDVAKAFEHARKYSSTVIIQEMIEDSIDTRSLIIGDEYIGTLIRKPAHVVGDGKSNLKELIESENSSGKRGVFYEKDLNIIPLDEAENYLGERIKYVPELDEEVLVIGAANVGKGGTTHDISDDLPKDLIQKMITMARTLGVGVLAVDMMVKKKGAVLDFTDPSNFRLIEVNFSPSLHIHNNPTTGQGRPAVEKFVDLLISRSI